MAVLACDVCGGKLVMGTGGVAVCDSCGMEHSKDRMQEKVQEIKGTVQVSNIASLESLMKRGRLALEDSDWKQADEYFNKVLDIDPEYAPAYVGKLCVELKVRQDEMLGNYKEPISEYNNFKKAVRFADVGYRSVLEGYNKSILERIAEGTRKTAEIRKKIAKFQNYISAGSRHTVGLKADNTVVAVGANEDGQCNTKKWRDIVAVAAGSFHTVGLKSNGTVIAVGSNLYGQCNTGSWQDIVAIATDSSYTVGLKPNGTVVTVGQYGVFNFQTHHYDHFDFDVSGWRDIVAITAQYERIFGLKADGTVVVVGDREEYQGNIKSWRDIVAITAGTHTVGLRPDGTVVAVGSNSEGQCNTEGWLDIVAIAAGSVHTAGLKSDGTVVVVGKNEYGQCNTGNWRGIVAIASSYGHIVGLKSDGMVVAVGNNEYGQCNTEGWKNIGPVPEEQVLESKQSLEQSKRWQEQGLCQYCGGKLGGVFTKKCKSCGKEN